MTNDIDTRDQIIADLSARLDAAQAEVERLKELNDVSKWRFKVQIVDREGERFGPWNYMDLAVDDIGHADKVFALSPEEPLVRLSELREAQAEVERLKVTADNMADMAAAAADDLDRYRAAAEMSTLECASARPDEFKRAFGADRLRLLTKFADKVPEAMRGMPVADYLCALLFPDETDRARAHTWQQERAAVVAFLDKQKTPLRSSVYFAGKIERGEHWPEGGAP